MKDELKSRLTAAEVNALWTNYTADSMAKILLKQFISTCEDKDVLKVLKYAIKLSEIHLEYIEKKFRDENIPIPIAFNDADYNEEAPRLFTDDFYLSYLKNMTKTGLSTYGALLSGSSRHDIRKYATENLNSTAELFNKATDLLVDRGIEIRCPLTPYPTLNEWIGSKHFLAGWWGEQRPLTNAEVSNLFVNLLSKNNIKTLMTGFSQVAQNKDVIKYLMKGKQLASKHGAIFTDYLLKSDLQAPVTWDTGVTKSVEVTFSDRLIMTQVVILMQACIADYGLSLSLCQRRDLSLQYVKLTSEISTYAVDGAKLMIENAWMEKPPMATDREDLSK